MVIDHTYATHKSLLTLLSLIRIVIMITSHYIYIVKSPSKFGYILRRASKSHRKTIIDFYDQLC